MYSPAELHAADTCSTFLCGGCVCLVYVSSRVHLLALTVSSCLLIPHNNEVACQAAMSSTRLNCLPLSYPARYCPADAMSTRIEVPGLAPGGPA